MVLKKLEDKLVDSLLPVLGKSSITSKNKSSLFSSIRLVSTSGLSIYSSIATFILLSGDNVYSAEALSTIEKSSVYEVTFVIYSLRRLIISFTIRG